jgi:hypothetical protein
MTNGFRSPLPQAARTLRYCLAMYPPDGYKPSTAARPALAG